MSLQDLAVMAGIGAETLLLVMILRPPARHWLGGKPVLRYVTITLLVLIPVGTLLVVRPIELRPREQRATGSYDNIGSLPGARTALLVSRSAIAESPDAFSQRIWSLAWVNTLEQEVGAFRVIDLDVTDEFDLEALDLVVLTRSARDRAATMADRLDDYVRGGGCLIIEMPDNSSRGMSGLAVGEPYLWEGEISWVNATHFRETGDLGARPVYALVSPALEIDPATSVVVEFGPGPAILARRHGLGLVQSLLYDHGLFLVSTQQGRPREDFTLVDTQGARGVLDPVDLLPFDPQNMGVEVPIADVLEKIVIGVIDSFRPLSRPWYFPFDFDGVALMTHDEDWYGDDSTYMIDHERSVNATSTFFIIPDSPITSDALAYMIANGAEVGIHWNREAYRSLGIFRRAPSLESQIRMLAAKLPPGESLTSCRIERFRWGPSWSDTFAILEAHAIVSDCTYGRGRGYLFGTGLPYHPLDRSGKPFAMWEVPFQNLPAWWGGGNETYMHSLFAESRAIYHEAIGALYHPLDCAGGGGAHPDWVGFLRSATEYNHWIVTMTGFTRWWSARDAAVGKVARNAEGLSIGFEGPVGICVMLPEFTPAGRLSTDADSRRVSVLGMPYVLVRLSETGEPVHVGWEPQGPA